MQSLNSLSSTIAALKRKIEEKSQLLRRKESDFLIKRGHRDRDRETARDKEIELTHEVSEHEKALKDLEAEKREIARKEAMLKAEEARIHIVTREQDRGKQTAAHSDEALRNLEEEISMLKREKANDEAELSRLEGELRRSEVLSNASSDRRKAA